MMRRYGTLYYVPDWVIDGLGGGSVERIDHGSDETALVVMSYGDTWSISTKVTPEMVEREREEWRRRVIESGGWVGPTVTLSIRVDENKCQGVIYNQGV